MKRNKIILINIIFVVMTVLFLILSLILNFIFFIPFFFLPIFCWLPFIFKNKSREFSDFSSHDLQNQDSKYCPICRGEIKEPIAKFCYHCGANLNKNIME